MSETGAICIASTKIVKAKRHGVLFRGDVDARVDGVRASHNSMYGIHIAGNSNVEICNSYSSENSVGFASSSSVFCKIIDSYAEKNLRHGYLSAQQIGRQIWQGCEANGNYGSGFVIGRTNQKDVASTGWIISNCKAKENGHNGFSVDPRRGGKNRNYSYSLHGVLSDCVAIRNGIHGFYISKAKKIRILASQGSDNQHSGFMIANSSSIAVIAPLATYNEKYGIVLAGKDMGTSDILIKSPKLWGNLSENYVNKSANKNVFVLQ